MFALTTRFLILPFIFAVSLPLHGGTIALSIARDTCLWELDSDYNMGTQRDLPCGTLGNMGERRRSRLLLQADIVLPTGASITGARYRVEVTMAPESGRENSTFSLHRMLSPWTEGEQRGDVPGGEVALEGESTWDYQAYSSRPWSQPGGRMGVEFASEASALARVRGVGPVVFEFTEKGISDLRSMLLAPESNHGWVMVTQEEERAKTARRFAAREHRSTVPVLEIDYEGGSVAAPTAWVPSIERDPTTGELIISAPAVEGKVYVLQSSRTLESKDWKNQEIAAEFILGNVSFRKSPDEDRRFARIVEEVSSSPP